MKTTIEEKTATKYALIRTPESARYGTIISTHRTAEAAHAALDRAASRVLRHAPNAIVYLMWTVCPLPTPAGETGKRGDRIAIDLSC